MIIEADKRESRPVVSFCIPVYNNAKAALAVVNSILYSNNDDRFEVVVCDDASTDNTEELLAEIHDPRFRYCRNDKNLGAHKNWLHSLELGRGEWLYLVMGRDTLHSRYTGKLIELLNYARENNITVMKDGDKTDSTIYSGIDAMLQFIGLNHPTGTIFNAELFRSIPNIEHYFEIADMYPENYVKRDMSLKGNGAFIMSGVFVYGYNLLYRFMHIKSRVEYGKNIFEMYYAPKRRTKQMLELIDMIDEPELPGVFTQEEINRFFEARYYKLLAMVSVLWHTLCTKKYWNSHYGIKTRHVTVSEMIGNIFTAHSTVKIHLQEKGTYTRSKRNIMKVCIVKVFIYHVLNNVCKRILEPLGIWAVLKAAKNFVKGRKE